jgi:hypothetical protein
MNNVYQKQVGLLLDALPEVAKEDCFTLHGGTAINLFVRNMPRLQSVNKHWQGLIMRLFVLKVVLKVCVHRSGFDTKVRYVSYRLMSGES